MPTRKQKRRELKSKRHEYEFVYVDEEGNELDEVPDDLREPAKKAREERTNGASASKGKQQPQTRGGRAGRTPPQPSWNRAFKRGALLGLVVFALFSLTAKGNYAAVIPLAAIYTVMFVPFTYLIDRFAYRRWQAKQAGGAAPTPKKR
jgi:hypothetical protein